jgi:hypothetical protein
MKIFNDFYSDEAVKFLLNEIKERNNNTSYILLEDFITKELINKIKGRMSKDETVLIKVKSDVVLEIYNSDVRDDYGSFGYTALYYNIYIPPKEPEILSVSKFFKRVNKLDPDYNNPLKGEKFRKSKDCLFDFMDSMFKN